MTAVHYTPPPVLQSAASLHETGRICLVCLMNAKGEQVTRTREIWQPLVADGKTTEQRWIEFAGQDEHAGIREAVVIGICDMFPGLMMPLCWDHLGAIAPPDPRPACTWCNGSGRKGSGIQPAAGPLPPGLSNGSHKRGRG